MGGAWDWRGEGGGTRASHGGEALGAGNAVGVRAVRGVHRIGVRVWVGVVVVVMGARG